MRCITAAWSLPPAGSSLVPCKTLATRALSCKGTAPCNSDVMLMLPACWVRQLAQSEAQAGAVRPLLSSMEVDERPVLDLPCRSDPRLFSSCRASSRAKCLKVRLITSCLAVHPAPLQPELGLVPAGHQALVRACAQHSTS